ncbi:MAG: tRNA pseudouridine(38-40) synthase TruA [Opitutaceae bacterium]|nr:tRNA pseudouridine(38-40) synthase TruA [Opitutaceae bacterium]
MKPIRWKCVCAYDGTNFAGWQSQARGVAIQDVIEARLQTVLKQPVRISGSGRTDAGVHAHGQVFHFDAAWPHGEQKLLIALRTGLPPGIQIKSAKPARADFHARFQATGKRYEYNLHLGDADPFTRPYSWMIFRELDIKAMQAAARHLLGRHDFRAFTALNGPEMNDTTRTLRRLNVIKRGRRVRIVCEGDGFLYKMVRSLVGVLVTVGEGKLAAEAVGEILRSRQRTEAVQTAPACGLFLMKVFY